MDDELRGPITLRLDQDGVHVDLWLGAGGDRLGRLCAADLAAVRGDGGVVRHVLWLKGADVETAIGKGAAEPGDEHRLADVRARALKHQRTHNSTPVTIHSSRQARR